MDIFSTGPPLSDGLAQWGTEVSSSPSYGAGVPIAGEIPPSSVATPHAAAAASPEPQPLASPRSKAPVQTGELELLPKSQIQKLVAAQLGMNPNLKLLVSQDAVDALQKAATIFAAYLSTVSHEVAIIENERRKVHQPTHVDTIESRNVIMATQFVMPEITEDLAHFVHNFDPVRDKARKDQEKAQRAATREREKREKQEKQMAKQQEAFEQDRLRQQMAFQQAQLGITQSIPSAADAEMEGAGGRGVKRGHDAIVSMSPDAGASAADVALLANIMGGPT